MYFTKILIIFYYMISKSKTKFINYKNIIFIFAILSCIFFMIIMPEIAMDSFMQGIRIWATKVLPSLLPFFLLTKLLSYTNFVTSIGKYLTPVTQKLYGVGGVSGYIFAMSIISGYPVGAKLTSDFYKNGVINNTQATIITSFTSTSGPLFILGSVAIGLFHNSTLGIIILISHYLGALINGFIYRRKNSIMVNTQTTLHSENFLNDSMTNSISSIMVVGGFIALFYMIISICISCNLFTPVTNLLQLIGINTDLSNSIICGLIEVTTGCIYLSNINLSFIVKGCILSFLISFGGFSIHAQAYCFLKNFKMSYPLFLLQKFTHAILSTILTFIIISVSI